MTRLVVAAVLMAVGILLIIFRRAVARSMMKRAKKKFPRVGEDFMELASPSLGLVPGIAFISAGILTLANAVASAG